MNLEPARPRGKATEIRLNHERDNTNIESGPGIGHRHGTDSLYMRRGAAPDASCSLADRRRHLSFVSA